MALFSLENRDFPGFRMIQMYLKYGLTKSFQILTQRCGPLNTGYVRLWCISLLPFLSYGPLFLENRDFPGFRMISKVWLNQIFSNFTTMLRTIKYRLSSIMVYFTFTIPELWPLFSEKIGTF